MVKRIQVFFSENNFFIFLAILVIGGGIYWGSKGGEVSQKEVSTAQYGTVQRGDVVVSVSGSGQVFAQDQVSIRPQIAGDGIEIAEVLVENNQEVKKDDVIAILDTEDAQKNVRDAELALWASKIKMDQTKDLYETLTIKDRRNRQLQEVNLRESEYRLIDSKEKLQDYFIRAPFDGIVT
ncbi:MAG: biotin/lipoyl-binding protein, partial [Candidatus Moranbacteria bacterium]|nr:biotin/lipoyl-binding protein [Candidatus Moranbacteria bacterium]